MARVTWPDSAREQWPDHWLEGDVPEPHIEVHTFQATIPSGAMLDPLTREPQYTPDGELLTWEGYFAAAALAYFIARSQMPKELRELLDAAEARIQRAFLFGTGGILRP